MTGVVVGNGTIIGLSLIIAGCLALGAMAQVSLTMPALALSKRRGRAVLAVVAGLAAAALVPAGLLVMREPGAPPNYVVLLVVAFADLGMTAFCVSVFWAAGRRADQKDADAGS